MTGMVVVEPSNRKMFPRGGIVRNRRPRPRAIRRKGRTYMDIVDDSRKKKNEDVVSIRKSVEKFF